MEKPKRKFQYTEHREGTARRARQLGHVNEAKTDRAEADYQADRRAIAKARQAEQRASDRSRQG